MASVLHELRKAAPARPLSMAEALRVAETQVAKLLRISEVNEPAVSELVISSLPRIQVERLDISSIAGGERISGSAHWAPGRWVIVINASDPFVRQRFTLAHEFKHVLDSPSQSIMFAKARDPELARERVADHFAACLLMPKIWVVRAWTHGQQNTTELARMFEVSTVAMNWRLQELGLTGPVARCEQPTSGLGKKTLDTTRRLMA